MFFFRDQQILSVFETIISSLDTKLQKIDNFDNVVKELVYRMEQLDSKININVNKINSFLNTVGSNQRQFSESNLNKTLLQDGSFGHLITLDKKISTVGDQLQEIRHSLQNNGRCPKNDFDIADPKPFQTNYDDVISSCVLQQLKNNLETSNETLNMFNNNVQKILRNSCEKLTGLNYEVKTEINTEREVNEKKIPDIAKVRVIQAKELKLNLLDKSPKPLNRRANRVALSLNDDLFPRSVEFITQTQRQERAIGGINEAIKSNNNNFEENSKEKEVKITPSNENNGVFLLNIDGDINPDTTTNLSETTTSFSNIETTLGELETTRSSFDNGVTENRSEAKKGGIIFPNVRNKPLGSNNSLTMDATNVTQETKVSMML